VLLAASLSVWLTATQAEEPPQPPAPTEPLAALPEHLGYAVNQPTILLRQRLFGLAHGLSMLAAACLDLPEHAPAVEDAYAAWYARQADSIKMLVIDLSTYHFGPHAEEAQWPDLARALNLKDSIHPSLKEVALEEACRTLPEATTRPRFAFDVLLSDPEKALVDLAPAQ
jgi:hypothetical protein